MIDQDPVSYDRLQLLIHRHEVLGSFLQEPLSRLAFFAGGSIHFRQRVAGCEPTLDTAIDRGQRLGGLRYQLVYLRALPEYLRE